MERIDIDSGVKEYQINNGGVLRFNPNDPNVYARFMDATEKIQAVETELVAKAKEIEKDADRHNSGAAVLRLMAEADRKTKDILTEVFGAANDFDKLLDGVNLLAVACNGERVITNLLEALRPIMVAGAENCAKQQSDAAVAEARQMRAQRLAQ